MTTLSYCFFLMVPCYECSPSDCTIKDDYNTLNFENLQLNANFPLYFSKNTLKRPHILRKSVLPPCFSP